MHLLWSLYSLKALSRQLNCLDDSLSQAHGGVGQSLEGPSLYLRNQPLCLVTLLFSDMLSFRLCRHNVTVIPRNAHVSPCLLCMEQPIVTDAQPFATPLHCVPWQQQVMTSWLLLNAGPAAGDGKAENDCLKNLTGIGDWWNLFTLLNPSVRGGRPGNWEGEMQARRLSHCQSEESVLWKWWKSFLLLPRRWLLFPARGKALWGVVLTDKTGQEHYCLDFTDD